jgi:hypothetical protein
LIRWRGIAGDEFYFYLIAPMAHFVEGDAGRHAALSHKEGQTGEGFGVESTAGYGSRDAI